MSRLPDDLSTPAGHLLKAAVRDFGWDGSYAAGLRRQGDTFFVGRAPITRKWGGLFRRFTLTSDQLWHMMFGLGPLQPAHMEMLCLFLGYPDHHVPLSQRPEANDPDRLLSLLREHVLTAPPDASRQTVEMATFVTSMAISVALNVPVFVDG